MPELPEVETIRRQLEKEAVGLKVVGVDVRWGGRLSPKPNEFSAAVSGRKIAGVGRRAKLLIVNFSGGKSLVIHLKMTGRLLLVPGTTPPGRHTHVVFSLSDGRKLFFEDIRKFGYIRLYETGSLESDVFTKEKYGPEPLSPSFSLDSFSGCLRRRPESRVKAALMDQSCLAGIGNIYADESLWRGGLRPNRRVGSLKEVEFRRLYRGAVASLRDSIKHGGSSSDDYLDLYGRQGGNVPRLKVYGREGKPCRRCGRPIVKVRQGGRGTHFCKYCQK
jgi:formamidopyrimidine-DNA glycosylase